MAVEADGASCTAFSPTPFPAGEASASPRLRRLTFRGDAPSAPASFPSLAVERRTAANANVAYWLTGLTSASPASLV